MDGDYFRFTFCFARLLDTFNNKEIGQIMRFVFHKAFGDKDYKGKPLTPRQKRVVFYMFIQIAEEQKHRRKISETRSRIMKERWAAVKKEQENVRFIEKVLQTINNE